jgi:hypothetical protein
MNSLEQGLLAMGQQEEPPSDDARFGSPPLAPNSLILARDWDLVLPASMPRANLRSSGGGCDLDGASRLRNSIGGRNRRIRPNHRVLRTYNGGKATRRKMR